MQWILENKLIQKQLFQELISICESLRHSESFRHENKHSLKIEEFVEQQNSCRILPYLLISIVSEWKRICYLSVWESMGSFFLSFFCVCASSFRFSSHHAPMKNSNHFIISASERWQISWHEVFGNVLIRFLLWKLVQVGIQIDLLCLVVELSIEVTLVGACPFIHWRSL